MIGSASCTFPSAITNDSAITCSEWESLRMNSFADPPLSTNRSLSRLFICVDQQSASHWENLEVTRQWKSLSGIARSGLAPHHGGASVWVCQMSDAQIWQDCRTHIWIRDNPIGSGTVGSGWSLLEPLPQLCAGYVQLRDDVTATFRTAFAKALLAQSGQYINNVMVNIT